MPEQPEVLGLLSLMLLHDSRRDARQSDAGELVVLSEQDRSRWDAGRIAEGLAALERASSLGPPGPYALQAAIAAEHARAESAEATDWRKIVRLYDLLLAAVPSPVVALNRAVAVALAFGPERGLALVDELGAQGELADYHLWHSARAELLARLGRRSEAADGFRRALDLATNEVDRRHLARRLEQLANQLP
jgi:RNA polymerase sigma-70 factor (ECF subfamily)